MLLLLLLEREAEGGVEPLPEDPMFGRVDEREARSIGTEGD